MKISDPAYCLDNVASTLLLVWAVL